MNDSVTIQEKDIVIDALKFEIANLRKEKTSVEIEADHISYCLGKMRTENLKLQVDLLKYEDEGGTPHNKGISDHRLGGAHKFYATK
jgi:hypothetical protein